MITTDTKKETMDDLKWNFKVPSSQPVTSSEDTYANKLITAYIKGVNIGKQKAITELKSKFLKEYNTNIKKAKSVAEDFFSYINDKKNLKCSTVYLKMNSVENFSLLFIIDEKTYLSEDFDIVYKRSIRKRKSLNNEKLHLSLMFIPDVSTLDKNKISNDGYTHKYGEAE